MFGIGESETNAIKLLKKDHDEVDAMFKQYESGKEDMRPAQKQQLATRICEMLTVHAAIEEEIFYPAVRNLDKEIKDLVAEAAVEHQSLKDIIGRLEAAPPSDPLYDAGVKVLAEYVKHHVKEEENELFPKVRSSELDLDALGERLMERKSELENPSGRSRGTKRGNSKSQEARGAKCQWARGLKRRHVASGLKCAVHLHVAIRLSTARFQRHQNCGQARRIVYPNAFQRLATRSLNRFHSRSGKSRSCDATASSAAVKAMRVCASNTCFLST